MSVIFEKADKSTDSKEAHRDRKLFPMLVTFAKTERLETVFREEHSNKKSSLISVIFEKADKSTDSKELHPERKDFPTFVVLVKTVILEIVFKDEHLDKNDALIPTTFEKADKSTDPKEEHRDRKS
eukprot:TRINITY_DN6290_c0_g2_i2.p2 TRINITY_DN6290_c0_g2~~TRINITY_DN6290_c0_g2_i2.p2  ORF type:complete len:126 (-),score=25.56 TRINITY_DN6290_c0_g2_i2:198-575(-)